MTSAAPPDPSAQPSAQPGGQSGGPPGAQPGRRADLPWLAQALQEAGQRAGRPGPLWLAGYAYHFLSFGWTFGLVLGLPFVDRLAPRVDWEDLPNLFQTGLVNAVVRPFDLGAWLLLLPLALTFFRLAGGLARLAPLGAWSAAAQQGGRSRPTLRRIWSAGHGSTRAAGLLWLQVTLMMGLIAAALVVPTWAVLSALGVEGQRPLLAVVSGLAVALVLLYGFLLGVLFQLALHSLVRNRRGVGSALLHAWRLVRNDPMAATRAVAMDGVVQLVSVAAQTLILLTMAALTGLALPGALLYLAVPACLGSVRALYWARVYDELGGLTTAQPKPA